MYTSVVKCNDYGVKRKRRTNRDENARRFQSLSFCKPIGVQIQVLFANQKRQVVLYIGI